MARVKKLVSMPSRLLELVKSGASEIGIDANAYILLAIYEKMERSNGKNTLAARQERARKQV